MKYFYYLSIIALAITLGACSSIFSSSNEIVLKFDDKQATCRIGDTIVIELQGNPTTGYDWTPVYYNDAVLKIVGRKFVATNKYMRKTVKSDDGEDVLVGAPGICEITFEAIAQGESKVEFQYERIWEKKPISKAEFMIYVKAM